jgi:hypothetical protein
MGDCQVEREPSIRVFTFCEGWIGGEEFFDGLICLILDRWGYINVSVSQKRKWVGERHGRLQRPSRHAS